MSYRRDIYAPLPQRKTVTELQVSGVNPSSTLDRQPTHIQNGKWAYAGRRRILCYIIIVKACKRDKQWNPLSNSPQKGLSLLQFECQFIIQHLERVFPTYQHSLSIWILWHSIKPCAVHQQCWAPLKFSSYNTTINPSNALLDGCWTSVQCLCLWNISVFFSNITQYKNKTHMVVIFWKKPVWEEHLRQIQRSMHTLL